MSDTNILAELQTLAEVQELTMDQRELFIIRMLLRHDSHFHSEKRNRDAFRQELRELINKFDSREDKLHERDTTELERTERRVLEVVAAYAKRIEALEGSDKSHSRLIYIGVGGVLLGSSILPYIIHVITKGAK